MKSPNPSQMAGRREGWRTSARLAWSVATSLSLSLSSVDNLSFASSSLHPVLRPRTYHLKMSGRTTDALMGSFSHGVILTGIIFRNMIDTTGCSFLARAGTAKYVCACAFNILLIKQNAFKAL